MVDRSLQMLPTRVNVQQAKRTTKATLIWSRRCASIEALLRQPSAHLLGSDAERFHDLVPLRDVVANQPIESFRRVTRWLGPELAQALAHVGRFHRGDGYGVQAVDDGPGRFRRREQPPPRCRVEA